MDIFDLLEITVIRRVIATFLQPKDWDSAASACLHFSSLARVHNTGFYFPGPIPASSYTFPIYGTRPFVLL